MCVCVRYVYVCVSVGKELDALARSSSSRKAGGTAPDVLFLNSGTTFIHVSTHTHVHAEISILLPIRT